MKQQSTRFSSRVVVVILIVVACSVTGWFAYRAWTSIDFGRSPGTKLPLLG